MSGVRGLSSLFFCYLPLQLIRAACRWKYSAAFSINQLIGSLWNVSAVSLVQGAINIGASTGFPVKLIGTPFKSVIWFQTICLFETIEVRRKRTENSLLGLGQSQIQTRMMFDFGRAPLTTSEHLRPPELFRGFSWAWYLPMLVWLGVCWVADYGHFFLQKLVKGNMLPAALTKGH